MTPEQRDKAVEWYGEGKSVRWIMEQTGCSVATIWKLMKRRGVTMRPIGRPGLEVTPEMEQDIRDRFARGESKAQLRKTLGVSWKKISAIVGKGARVAAFDGARGPATSGWKGGRRVEIGGYICIWLPPEDPLYCMVSKNGTVREHRLVVARHLGRPLTRDEGVHHIDGDKRNNDLSNLQLTRRSHGVGMCFQCADCGGRNIVEVPI